MDDRVGGAADKIEPLAKAGANFEFVFAVALQSSRVWA
jgi:hypothetical protein